ncbi:hypothetical protein ANCCAN_22521 [Ancylostoma caninum]|uniref:G-protein coupled receptors family 1 profile domain-containing protein n=1 Tax=Ancylostoma caninum TaxID=29170 RepID=A0A368FHH8_ANCCA|nr:hypothetical protein ANCCAN_22521 [Ancylostoma caninum]
MKGSTAIPLSPMITIQDYQLAAITVFTIAFMGTICNSLVAVFTRRLASLNNAFGRLTASQAAGEMILCGTFAFYFSPMVYFDSPWMKQHAQYAGVVLLMCYNICIVSHLFIALNRMCAICFPLKYDICFSYRNTTYLIVFSWVLSILLPFFLHGIGECNLLYSDSAWVFMFRATERCGFISWYFDFGQDFAVVVFIAIIDTITIIRVRLTAAEIQKSGCRVTTSKRTRDVTFLKQAVAQGIIFAVELYTYFFLGWEFTNKWMIFLFTTVAWNVVHCCDP